MGYVGLDAPTADPVFRGQTGRKGWISARSEQIMGNPVDLALAFAKYIDLRPTECGQALKNCSGYGTVAHMLELDGLLQKAAEIAADEEWSDYERGYL